MLGTLAAGTTSQISAGQVPALSWDVSVPTIPCDKGSDQPQNLPHRNQPITTRRMEAGILTWVHLANSLCISFLSFLCFCFSLSHTWYCNTLGFGKFVSFFSPQLRPEFAVTRLLLSERGNFSDSTGLLYSSIYGSLSPNENVE